MSNVVKKVKKQVILGFFHILLGDYLLKQEAVVVKPPEWKFVAIIARSINSCIPLFLQPTRITSHSNTLIDNMFSNVIDPDILSGNLTTTI